MHGCIVLKIFGSGLLLTKDIGWLIYCCFLGLAHLFNCLTWFNYLLTSFTFASGDTCRLQESQGKSDVQKERRGARRALYVEGGQFHWPENTCASSLLFLAFDVKLIWCEIFCWTVECQHLSFWTSLVLNLGPAMGWLRNFNLMSSLMEIGTLILGIACFRLSYDPKWDVFSFWIRQSR